MDLLFIESRVTLVPSKIRRWLLLGLRILGVMGLFTPCLARADYTFMVGTTTDDVSLQSCGSTTSVYCSLRGAIHDASQLKVAGTIILQSGVTYTITQGVIVIQYPVTINVNGSSNAILDGNHQDRLFDIQPLISNPTVVFDDLTIQNGEVPTGASSSSAGGGIHGSACTLILNGCLIRNNSTQDSGSSQPMGDGGGVEVGGTASQEATLSIENTTISGNLGQNGGGVSCSTCSLTITGSVLSGNTSEGPVGGGGLYLTGMTSVNPADVSSATISGTSFSNNTAQTVTDGSNTEGGNGGGIAVASSSVDLGNETPGAFSGDTAQGSGSEIDNSTDLPGTITLPTTWPTTTTLSATPATTDEYGQPVSLSASVAFNSIGGSIPVAGTLAITDNTTSTTLGSVSITGSSASNTLSVSNSALSVGAHPLQASYSGAFTSSASPVLGYTIIPNSQVSLSSSTNPSDISQSVTFTATVSAVSPASGTPTGTVIFMDGTTTLGTRTLSGGSATISASSLALGNHSITAVYSGDSNFITSTSPIFTQTVDTILGVSLQILSSDGSTTRFGIPVTFRAAVSGLPFTPTGTVTFKDSLSSDPLGIASLNNGVATFSTSAVPVGSLSITAFYSGDSNYRGGEFGSVALNVLPTIIGLNSSVNPSLPGQSVTFTATVGGATTGTVTFQADGATLGTGTVNSSGVATFTTSSLSIGTTFIVAVYSADPNLPTVTSHVYAQSVLVPSSTVLISSENPSVYGDAVTFTATVSPGPLNPTGTVTFLDGTTTLGTGTLNGSGVATFSTSSLSVGGHSITASYEDNMLIFAPSTSPALTQTVNATSATVLISSANPSAYGQSVTFTATVSAVGTIPFSPTGTVTFLDGTTTLGTGTLSAKNFAFVATFSTSALPVGSHSITASYGGDSNFSTSASSVLSQTVNKAGTTTVLGSSVHPSTYGESVKFSARVGAVSPGSGTPTGTVTFKDGTTTLGAVTLNGSGGASISISALSAGSHSITAAYGGDSNFSTSVSTPLTQTVDKASTTTALISSLNPSVFGGSVTFTATVSAVAPGSGTPTGTATFMNGSTTLGTGTLSGGIATFTTSALPVGIPSITASYDGDSNFFTSTSSALNQRVNRASTTTVLGSSVNPSVSGEAVTFTVSVGAVSPGSGTPTGTVTFKNGTATLGTKSLGGGSATFTLSSLSLGSPSITAVYSGDSDFSGSTSTALTQTVEVETPPTTTATPSPSLNAAGWTNAADVAVTLSATVVGYGFQQMTYRETGATILTSQTTTQNPFTVHVTNEGITHLFFYSTDTSGNAETEKSIDISIDRTPPLGTLGINTATGTLQLTLQDALSGLTPIPLSLLTNCTMTAIDTTTNKSLTIDWTDASDGTISWNTGTTESMIAGATDPIVATTDTIQLTAVKTDLSQKASLTLKALDQAGNPTSYDPVISSLSLSQKTSVRQTFSHLQPDQGHLNVLNGAKGIQSLDIDYNGQAFHLANLQPNEARRIDVSSAYRKTLNNTMTVTAQGAAGSAATVVLTDLNVVPLNGPSTGTPAGTGWTVGDVNGDGKCEARSDCVGIQDAVRLLQSIVGLDPLAGTALQAADVNSDGKINILDVTALLKRIVDGG